MKLSAIQLRVSEDVADNLNRAITLVQKAEAEGTDLIVLPEMFVCPYTHDAFKTYGQTVEGQWVNALKRLTGDMKATLVAGSMPIRQGDQLTNTSLVFQSGEIIARHDKVHLFDINIPGEMTFFESDTLTAGNHATTFKVGERIVGLGICYDMRFHELFMDMSESGAELIIIPAAFNTVTGPAHWELLARSRAMDYQCFMALVSPSSEPDAAYVTYGHSMVVDPWGVILKEANKKEEIFSVKLDFDVLTRVRTSMPLKEHKRRDLWELNVLKGSI
jgi:predicted amidohydrolase